MRAAALIAVVVLGCGKTKDTSTPSSTTPSTTPPTTTEPTEPTDTTDTGSPATSGCEVLDVSVTDNPDMVLYKTLHIEVDEASPVTVHCTAADDPDEAHYVTSAAEATGHEVSVYGLIADTTYTCEVTPACATTPTVVETATGTLPSLIPAYTTTRNDALEMSGAYTLFNDAEVCSEGPGMDRVVIVDPEGNVRWYHIIPEDLVVDLDVRYLDGQVYYGGGWGLFDTGAANPGVTRRLELDGTEVYTRATPTYGLGFNHHADQLASGEYLTLTSTYNTASSGAQIFGIAVEVFDPVTETATYTWESQGAIDAGYLDATPALDGRLNANSVTWTDDDDGPAMYISEYYSSAIVRVDRDSGDVTWKLGRDGDFTLLDDEGNVLPDEEWFYGQHDPEFDGNRVLLHDNGTDRPIAAADRYSRALELELDVPARTATVVWSWTEPGWFEPVVGDADRLANDNRLITQGHCDCCWWRGFGNPIGNDSSIVEVEPATGDVVWRVDWPDEDAAAYRAQRIDGCDVFANARYCDDLTP